MPLPAVASVPEGVDFRALCHRKSVNQKGSPAQHWRIAKQTHCESNIFLRDSNFHRTMQDSHHEHSDTNSVMQSTMDLSPSSLHLCESVPRNIDTEKKNFIFCLHNPAARWYETDMTCRRGHLETNSCPSPPRRQPSSLFLFSTNPPPAQHMRPTRARF